MAYEVTILHSATIELTQILEWYNAQNDFSVNRFHDAYLVAVEKLTSNPQFYSYIHKQFRRVLIDKYPYKIIYQITGNKVIIYRISHTSRDDRNWFKNV